MLLCMATLKSKDVIRLCDGKSLGCVSDIRFDSCTGCVVSLCVLADNGGFFPFCGEELIIPWNKIHCIGEDAVLVNVQGDECRQSKKKHK